MKAGSVRGRLSDTDDSNEKTVENACAIAKGALEDAFDLLLIHNEKLVRGNQPRTVLNPLIVLLSISAWERLVYATGEAIAYRGRANGERPLSKKQTVGRLMDAPLRRGNGPIGPSVAHEIMSQATFGVLPEAWSITFYRDPHSRGKCIRPSDTLTGASYTTLASRFDHYVDLRDGVAHRVLPAKMKDAIPEHALRTDAGKHLPDEDSGLTINATTSRGILASCIQLIDQSIVHLLANRGYSPKQINKYRLPDWWFDDKGHDGGESRTVEEHALWGGTTVPRTE